MIHNEVGSYVHELEILAELVGEYAGLADETTLTHNECVRMLRTLKRHADRAEEARRLIGHAVRHKLGQDVDAWPHPKGYTR